MRGNINPVILGEARLLLTAVEANGKKPPALVDKQVMAALSGPEFDAIRKMKFKFQVDLKEDGVMVFAANDESP